MRHGAHQVAQKKSEYLYAMGAEEPPTGGFQALFRVPGRVSIASNEGAKSLRIASATIEPELLVRAAPALDATAFLEASFKHTEDAPLLAGRVAIYRDDIYVGRGAMPAFAGTLSEEEIAEGIRHAYWQEKQIVEGSGAVGLGALLVDRVKAKGATVVLLSGGKIDMTQHARVIAGETIEPSDEERD